FRDSARAIRATERLALDTAPHGVAASELETQSESDAAVRPASESAPFVGRGVEFGMLVALIARLTTGSGQTVLIEGEPGIGKSRLMREVARYAQAQGLPTLATNCFEIDRAMPYQPVIDLITRALDRASSAALRNIAPVSLAELAALAPTVAERFPGLPQLSRDFPEARQARLSRAVGQLLESTAEGRPLILLVDDIQWADDASAQLLHYLARHVAERPVLLIYAYRDENVASDEPLARWVESLRRETDARHVLLARLGLADAERLVAALGDAGPAAPGLAERLHRETEGNPFFIVSILQSLSEGEIPLEARASREPAMLPDALRAAVRARITRVPQEIRPILESAAVIGRRFDFDTLIDVTHESEGPLLDALEALVKRRLLREEAEGGVYDFSHDKVREVVYRDIGGTRRRLLHRSVAEVLERRGEGEAHERDARLAEHYERAQVWPKALKYLILAGERSQALFAMSDALHWMDRAVALAESHPEALGARERDALYGRRGAARAQAGLTEGAVSDMRRVINSAREAGERDRVRDALIQLGMAYRRADAYDEATGCLTAALAESRAMNDEHHAADTLYHLGTVAWSTGLNNQAIGFHQEAIDICVRSGLDDLVAVQAYHGRGEAHFANAEPEAAIRCYTRSIELARGIGDKSYESENLMMVGYACTGSKGLGDYPRALQNLEAALAIARTADLQWHMGPTMLGLDHVRACAGNYGAAWAGINKTMDWLKSLKQIRYQFIAFDCIGHLLLDLDLNEQALDQMERGLALSRATGIEYWRPAIEAHRAIARSRLGYRDVASELNDALERAARNCERYLMARCLEGLCEAALHQGEASGGRSFADKLLALAQSNGLRELEASAQRWQGEAWLAERDYAQAQRAFSRAATLAAEIGRVRLHLDAQIGLARLCAAQNQHEAAERHRNEAQALTRAIEQTLVSSGIEARLRPSGNPY
ncbi:MAG: AAA family ATPase, partial [Betaproteobacteria bacterium]|nr:AAA family ATPase [Betaproteobacteria bacterium]